MKDGKKTHAQVDDIVLVGGSSRIPAVQDMLTEMFKKPLSFRVNPDEAVAVGAAVLAAQLSGLIPKEEVQFQDIVPQSLGIGTTFHGSKEINKDFSVLIKRNTKIPYKKTQNYGCAFDM